MKVIGINGSPGKTQDAASKFDERHKAQVRAEQFPTDCNCAFDLGSKTEFNVKSQQRT